MKSVFSYQFLVISLRKIAKRFSAPTQRRAASLQPTTYTPHTYFPVASVLSPYNRGHKRDASKDFYSTNFAFSQQNHRKVGVGVNLQPKQKGYSLVEVLVAITVLLIALVGPLTIAASGLKRANLAKEQTVAIFLAQEGTEAIVKLREDAALAATSFDNLNQVWRNTFNAIGSRCPIGSSNYCGVNIAENGTVNSSSIYQCSGSNCLIKHQSSARVPYRQGVSASGDNTAYIRQLQITVTGDAYARVVSTVSWGPAASDKVTTETYVYNIYYEP